MMFVIVGTGVPDGPLCVANSTKRLVGYVWSENKKKGKPIGLLATFIFAT